MLSIFLEKVVEILDTVDKDEFSDDEHSLPKVYQKFEAIVFSFPNDGNETDEDAAYEDGRNLRQNSSTTYKRG